MIHLTCLLPLQASIHSLVRLHLTSHVYCVRVCHSQMPTVAPTVPPTLPPTQAPTQVWLSAAHDMATGPCPDLCSLLLPHRRTSLAPLCMARRLNLTVWGCLMCMPGAYGDADHPPDAAALTAADTGE